MSESTPSVAFTEDLTQLLNFSSVFIGACPSNPSLATHASLFLEIVYCRFVDRYLIHTSEVLAKLFTKRPEMMKSNEKVEVSMILGHTTMPSLISSLVERKVMDLAHLGMRDLAKYFDDKLNLPLFETEEELDTAVVAVELRNLVIHNNGVVNKRFMDRAPSFSCSLGQRIRFTDADLLLKHEKLLIDSAHRLNIQVLKKFGTGF